MRLTGKVAMITGGASGIGRSTALVFAREGANIVIADVNTAMAEETVGQIKKAGGEASFVPLDISQADQVQKAVKATVDKYEKLDILFNNAAINPTGSVTDMSEEVWDREMAVNLKGVFLCSKYAIPEMKKIGSGAIINTASTVGILASTNNSAYCTSKAGVIMLTKQMALDYAPFNIRVNCICPGFTQTPLLEKFFNAQPDPEASRQAVDAMHPMGRLGKPEDIAYGALYLASDEASWVTGIALVIDGGLICHI